MKRYSIIARQIGADYDSEVCQCENNPEAIVAALQSKTTTGRKHLRIYEVVRFIDNQADR